MSAAVMDAQLAAFKTPVTPARCNVDAFVERSAALKQVVFNRYIYKYCCSPTWVLGKGSWSTLTFRLALNLNRLKYLKYPFPLCNTARGSQGKVHLAIYPRSYFGKGVYFPIVF